MNGTFHVAFTVPLRLTGEPAEARVSVVGDVRARRELLRADPRTTGCVEVLDPGCRRSVQRSGGLGAQTMIEQDLDVVAIDAASCDGLTATGGPAAHRLLTGHEPEARRRRAERATSVAHQVPAVETTAAPAVTNAAGSDEPLPAATTGTMSRTLASVPQHSRLGVWVALGVGGGLLGIAALLFVGTRLLAPTPAPEVASDTPITQEPVPAAAAPETNESTKAEPLVAPSVAASIAPPEPTSVSTPTHAVAKPKPVVENKPGAPKKVTKPPVAPKQPTPTRTQVKKSDLYSDR